MVVIGNPVDFDQILRQLNKLVDVVHASHHESSDSVDREMALFKVEVEPEPEEVEGEEAELEEGEEAPEPTEEGSEEKE